MIDLMREAYRFAALNSDDTSTQNGAIILAEGGELVYGANRFPPGLFTPDTREELLGDRDVKLTNIEHAERDVIYEAARNGIRTGGESVMVCPWACCAPCARAIVMAGIRTLVVHKQALDKSPERWQKPIEDGRRILKYGGVSYVLFDSKIRGVANLFNGETWLP